MAARKRQDHCVRADYANISFVLQNLQKAQASLSPLTLALGTGVPFFLVCGFGAEPLLPAQAEASRILDGFGRISNRLAEFPDELLLNQFQLALGLALALAIAGILAAEILVL